MDVAYISALAALAGSVVGGLTSGITSWLNQRAHAKAEHLAHEFAQREDLFRDFIVAVSKAYGEALMSAEPKVEELVGIYAMVSRMRVSCLPRTAACAEKVMLTTIATYSAPNKTIHELHDLMQNDEGLDPLKDFAGAAREELRSFTFL